MEVQSDLSRKTKEVALLMVYPCFQGRATPFQQQTCRTAVPATAAFATSVCYILEIHTCGVKQAAGWVQQFTRIACGVQLGT
jgi:hypothetical protein